MGVEEMKRMSEILLELDAELDQQIEMRKAIVSGAEREEASKRNSALAFTIDPQLSLDDVKQIVDLIETSELLDPRILSVRSAGTNAIVVMTGEIRGPLAGGGFMIHFQKTANQWRVTHVSHWVS